MLPTTDAHEGAREASRMPTYHCEGCGAAVWDSEVLAALAEVSPRSEGPAAVREAVAGAVCPACGYEQDG